MLAEPVVLLVSARLPMAVLEFSVVLPKSAPEPMAVLLAPLVRLKSAPSPSAVFSDGYSVRCWAELCATCRRKRNAGECERCERRVKNIHCCFQSFVFVSLSLA